MDLHWALRTNVGGRVADRERLLAGTGLEERRGCHFKKGSKKLRSFSPKDQDLS